MAKDYIICNGELYHFGVKGMKWGVRKAPTPATGAYRSKKQQLRDDYKQAKAQYKQDRKAERSTPEAVAARKANIKKGIKIGAAVAGTALAAYGAYKLNKFVKTKNAQIAAKRGAEVANQLFNGQVDSFAKSMASDRSISRGSVRVNVGQMAGSYARDASRDNFRTAARNVANYKRSGNSLRNLSSVSSYRNLDDLIWESRR